MRYLLFAGDHYYPSGGWNDYRGCYETIFAARVNGAGYDWSHVVDGLTMQIIPTKSEIIAELRRRLHMSEHRIMKDINEAPKSQADRVVLRAHLEQVRSILNDLDLAIAWFEENICE